MGLGIPQGRLPWKPLLVAVALGLGGAGCIAVPEWTPFTQQVGTPDALSDSGDGLNVPDSSVSDLAGDGLSDSVGDGFSDGFSDASDSGLFEGGPSLDTLAPDTSQVSTPQLLGSRSQGATPLLVMFDAANVDLSDSELLTGAVSDMGSLDYFWDFGDGNTARGMMAPHVFETAQAQQSFSVTLTVRNRAGDTESFVQVVTVQTPPAAQTLCLFDEDESPGSETPTPQEAPDCGSIVVSKDIEVALLTTGANTQQILLEWKGDFELSVTKRRLFREGLRIRARGTGPPQDRPKVFVSELQPFVLDAHDVAISNVTFYGDSEGATCRNGGACVLVQPDEERTEPTFEHFLLHQVDGTSFDTVLGSAPSLPRWSGVIGGAFDQTANAASLMYLSGTGNALAGVTMAGGGTTRPDLLNCGQGCLNLVIKDCEAQHGHDSTTVEATLLELGTIDVSSRVLLQGNTFSVYAGPQVIYLGSDASGIVVERNLFTAPDGLSAGHSGFVVAAGSDIVLRHNLMNLSIGPDGARGMLLIGSGGAAYNNTCGGVDPGSGKTSVCVESDEGDVRANLTFGGVFQGTATETGNLVWPVGNAVAGGFNVADGYRVAANEGAVTLYGDGLDVPVYADYGGHCIPVDPVRFGAWQVLEGEPPDGSGCSGD